MLGLSCPHTQGGGILSNVVIRPPVCLSVCLSHAHGSNAVHLMARVTRTLTANPTLEVETLVSMAVLDYTSSS